MWKIKLSEKLKARLSPVYNAQGLRDDGHCNPCLSREDRMTPGALCQIMGKAKGGQIVLSLPLSRCWGFHFVIISRIAIIWQYWGLNTGPRACQACALSPDHAPQSAVDFFFNIPIEFSFQTQSLCRAQWTQAVSPSYWEEGSDFPPYSPRFHQSRFVIQMWLLGSFPYLSSSYPEERIFHDKDKVRRLLYNSPVFPPQYFNSYLVEIVGFFPNLPIMYMYCPRSCPHWFQWREMLNEVLLRFL